MITVTVLIGKGEAGATETISAASIWEAVSIAQARHPGEEIRVACPIDPETFFPERLPREAAGFR
jgi:hypothetical protein